MADVNPYVEAGNAVQGVMSGIGAYMSGKGTAASARENAKIARLNKQKSNLNYAAQIREVLTNKAIQLDSNRVEWAWGGLTMEGTPGLVNKNVASGYDADVSILKQNQKIDANIYETQARAYEKEAEAAEKAGTWGAISSFVGAAASTAAIIAL